MMYCRRRLRSKRPTWATLLSMLRLSLGLFPLHRQHFQTPSRCPPWIVCAAVPSVPSAAVVAPEKQIRNCDHSQPLLTNHERKLVGQRNWNCLLYLCFTLLFFGFQSFSLLISLGFHLVIVGPQLLPAVLNKLRAKAVELADQIKNLFDEEACITNARLSVFLFNWESFSLKDWNVAVFLAGILRVELEQERDDALVDVDDCVLLRGVKSRRQRVETVRTQFGRFVWKGKLCWFTMTFKAVVCLQSSNSFNS